MSVTSYATSHARPINNKRHRHHGFLAPRAYLCSTSLSTTAPLQLLQCPYNIHVFCYTVIYTGHLPIINYTSVLIAYVTNQSFWTCKIASKHSLQAGVSISFGFSQKLSILQPVKIRHMANHKYTNPARGILDFCKQKLWPLPCSQLKKHRMCWRMRFRSRRTWNEQN